mmetsp:Transcript_11605/g.71371  ORF Transcript_11605/g.71371 Transcript_11605/m.71371 type:complete len:252 (-) Transcript_11605:432-1187(-)
MCPNNSTLFQGLQWTEKRSPASLGWFLERVFHTSHSFQSAIYNFLVELFFQFSIGRILVHQMSVFAKPRPSEFVSAYLHDLRHLGLVEEVSPRGCTEVSVVHFVIHRGSSNIIFFFLEESALVPVLLHELDFRLFLLRVRWFGLFGLFFLLPCLSNPEFVISQEPCNLPLFPVFVLFRVSVFDVGIYILYLAVFFRLLTHALLFLQLQGHHFLGFFASLFRFRSLLLIPRVLVHVLLFFALPFVFAHENRT